ncbi:MAG TPA: hypothetical protein VES02_06260 [Dermatophilaceae bacterium]|nr:hypothetical protein [Dermatophilaceae bacterium]
MSKPGQPVGERVDRPVERALFRALFDDAAVFPPGIAPLPQAVADHVARQSGPYADLVGPLLLPASAIEDFLHLDRPPQVEVALIGRTGADLELVDDATSRLGQDPGVTLTGVEIGWSPQWERAVGWSASLSVEVPRSAGQQRALSELQRHAAGPGLVQANFRTGATTDTPAPTLTELAVFIRAAVDHDLGFKLTGGLHHAISQTTAEGQNQIGFLNVIAATRWALAHGAEVPEMETLLAQREPVPILDIITRMSGADASVVRAFFTAYGCCGVMDPIGDLGSLGLIKEPTG